MLQSILGIIAAILPAIIKLISKSPTEEELEAAKDYLAKLPDRLEEMRLANRKASINKKPADLNRVVNG